MPHQTYNQNLWIAETFELDLRLRCADSMIKFLMRRRAEPMADNKITPAIDAHTVDLALVPELMRSKVPGWGLAK